MAVDLRPRIGCWTRPPRRRTSPRAWCGARCWCWTGLRAVSAAGDRKAVSIAPAPDDHFAPGPDRGGIVSGARRIDSAGGRPTIDKGAVPASAVKEGETVAPAPHDHFTANP